MNDFKNDFDSLVEPHSRFDTADRRDFLKIALGTGFAAAAFPISAQTVIKTDATGLDEDEIVIDVDEQYLPVYRVQPRGKTNLPVMLLVHEIFGLHEHIRDVARRFAKQGYLVLAPDLFIRQGNPAAYGTVAELMKEVIASVPDEQVMGDLDACVAWAAKNGGNVDKLGITGFCWGGRIVWLYCAHNSKVKAGVAWYGHLTGAKTALKPKNPIDIAPNLKVPVLGLYGAKDNGIPLSSIERMKSALAKSSSGSTFVVYPDAGHAFNADYRPSYVATAAKDGWKRCLDWFMSLGVG